MDIPHINIFSHSIGCLFIFLIDSFAVNKLFSDSVPFVYFLLLLLLFLISNPTNNCQDHCHGVGLSILFLLSICPLLRQQHTVLITIAM